MLYEFLNDPITFIVVVLLTFIGLFYIAFSIKNKKYLKINSDITDLEQVLPSDEIRTLLQLFYIAMGALFLFSIICEFLGSEFWLEQSIIDIIICVIGMYIIIKENDSYKYIIPLILLVPCSSLYFIFYGMSIMNMSSHFELIHIFGLVYASYYFIRKFIKYTKHNDLGLTILLLLGIVAISLILTIIFEDRSVLDAFCMVTNAFTSNGYTVLGTSNIGKVDSLFLTWGGYLLSGVGTATLTAAILSKFFNNRFNAFKKDFIEEYDTRNEKIDEDINQLNDNIKILIDKME